MRYDVPHDRGNSGIPIPRRLLQVTPTWQRTTRIFQWSLEREFMYFAGKLVYLIVRASNQLAVRVPHTSMTSHAPGVGWGQNVGLKRFLPYFWPIEFEFRPINFCQKGTLYPFKQCSKWITSLRNIAMPDYQKKCDYRTDRQTGGRTDRQTDRPMPDKVNPMCRYVSQATQKWFKSIHCNSHSISIWFLGQPHFSPACLLYLKYRIWCRESCFRFLSSY